MKTAKASTIASMCIAAALAAQAQRMSKIDPSKPISAQICAAVVDNHVTGKPLTGELSRRAWTNVIDTIDSSHMIFLAGDLDELSEGADDIAAAMEKGDMTLARKIRERFQKRLGECLVFSTNFLATAKWDFTKDGDFKTDRSKEPWPADDAARRALWETALTSFTLDKYLEAESNGVAKAAKKVSDDLVKKYVSETNKTEKASGEIFMRCIVASYDAHTQYMPRQIYKSFRSQMDLEFCGIGAQWQLKDGKATITRVLPGGPLDKDGRVRAGDVITAVSKDAEAPAVPTEGKQIEEISEMFTGKKGTPVLLEVRHEDGTEEPCRIIRDRVPLDDEHAYSRLDETKAGSRTAKIGYLRLPSFYAGDGGPDGKATSCSVDLKKELVKLRDAGVEGILFDLRDNPGGSLADAVKIISYFVDGGPAVRMKGRVQEVSLPAPSGETLCDKPVLVMTSKGSASAGELIPATLQDYNRAIIVGDERTFGKGTAQTVVELDEKKQGVVVTEGRFYRITGGSTQFKGVESDILLPSLAMDHGYTGEQGMKFALPWNSISGEKFEPAWDLRKFVPEISRRSAKRLEGNEKWRKHMDDVEFAKSYATDNVLPMNIEKRKAVRKHAKEIREELERSMKLTEGEARKTRKPGDDIVLDEAVAMLGDLIELNAGRKMPKHKLAEPDTSAFLDDEDMDD